MQDRIAGFFDGYAHGFDALYATRKNVLSNLINRVFRKSMLMRYQKSFEACSPIEGMSLLDVGCGPGHYSIGFAQKGAKAIRGIDFAPGMIEIARSRAEALKLSQICRFEVQDFFILPEDEKYDYVILMGFMDYMENPELAVRKAISISKVCAVFSFPASGGFLAWQRKLRYKTKCPLYLYDHDRIDSLFSSIEGITYSIDRISRDYFVKVTIV